MKEGQVRGPLRAGTIFALATAPGRAAIAIVRVSGPEADAALSVLSGSLPPQRVMSLRMLRSPESGEAIDQALVVRFPEGASYTGESSCEFHVHGGRATVARLLSELGRRPGLRLAEPGEFTRRGLENGVVDLAQAESLADLIEAETELQRRQALALATGSLSRSVALWRGRLIDLLARLEATMEFSEEPDISDDLAEGARPLMDALWEEIEAISVSRQFGRGLREGFSVAIVGPPNAGKSTLLNGIAGEDVAIASPEPGTTRDVIRVRRDLDGVPVWFLDTAGLRETKDRVELIGVTRALAAADSADLRLFVESADARSFGVTAPWRTGDIRVWLKADIMVGEADVSVSAVSGDGMVALLDLIRERLIGRAPPAAVMANERQAAHLAEAATALRLARDDPETEIAAAHLRTAAFALDKVIGRVDAEDVLDEVFSRFCVGK